VALWLVVQLRLSAWVRGQSSPPVAGLDWVPEEQWAWGAPGDFVLFGPDAGNWAANARALMQGGEPDINRLPVFGLLTWAVSAWRDVDVVFGGHLVNHLVGVALGCVVYFLGRELGGRAVGLGAGLLTAASPWLIKAASLYGVDPSFGLTTALLFLTTWLAVRHLWAVPLAGLAMGLVMATHYLGILFPLPCALALALRWGDWRLRVGTPVVALCVGWLSFRGLMWRYPAIGLDQIASVYSTGAASGLDDASVETAGFGTNVAEILGEVVTSGAMLAVQQNLIPLRDAGLPWALVLGLFWLGVLGFGLPPRVDQKDKRWAVDWRSGLVLLALLAPLALLEAVRAPERYRYYAQPLVFIVVLRGAASAAVTLERALAPMLPRTWPRWPVGLLALPLCWAVWATPVAGMRAQWSRGAPADQGLHERLIGEAVLEAFGAGGGIVTNSQVAAFHAERERCSGPAPGQATAPQAIAQLKERCSGRGDLPYLVGVRTSAGFADIKDEALDAYVAETFEAVGAIRGKETTTTVYRIPR
jgi:hypothetical protein